MALDVSLFLLGLDVAAAPSGGGNSYTAKAVVIPRPLTVQNVSLTAGSSSKFTLAYWFRLPSSEPNWLRFGSGVFFIQVPPGSSTENLYSIIQPNADKTAAQFSTAVRGGGSIAQIDSDFVIVADTWYLMLISCDLDHADGAKQLQQYLGDTDQAITVTDGQPAFAINFSGMQVGMADFAFIDASFATPALEVSDFALWVGQAPDLSITANRRLFIDGAGKPVNPAVAIAALGTPAVLLSGDSAGYAVNQGSGGSDFGVFASFIVPGRNGAGSVSVPGAQVGASVLTVYNDNDFSVLAADFEAVISVADQIQQTSADDFSAANLDIALHQGVLTNAASHP